MDELYDVDSKALAPELVTILGRVGLLQWSSRILGSFLLASGRCPLENAQRLTFAADVNEWDTAEVPLPYPASLVFGPR